MAQTFSALVLDEADGKATAAIKTLSDAELPEGDVTVRVCYSTLNYKDGLVLNGLGRLVRKYPHIPGIDFSGIVEDSRNPAYRVGDKVILTGWRVGEIHWGGYAQRARVKAEWLVPLPRGLDLKRAMAIGTAGFTAMLAALALEENGLKPGTEAEVCVTGAAGGLVGVRSRRPDRIAYGCGTAPRDESDPIGCQSDRASGAHVCGEYLYTDAPTTRRDDTAGERGALQWTRF